jgi:NADH:ubiquinone oxidoreductase subunit K
MIILKLNSFEKMLFVVKNVTFAMPIHYSFGFALFFIGLLGIVYNYKNFLTTMIAAELMYLGITVLFVLTGYYYNNEGQIYGLLLVMIATSESAKSIDLPNLYNTISIPNTIADYQESIG